MKSSEVSENIMSITVVYEFMSGMPASLMPRLINECLHLGDVMFVELWGCVAQQGDVEIRIKNSIHASKLLNSLVER